MPDPRNPRAPITTGFDTNFFQRITVTNLGFVESSDILINIKNQQSFSMINEGTDIVEYSFNGRTLHGDMVPGKPSEALMFDNRRISKIWFRAPNSGSHVIRVEAWAHM
ncbi:hypothetical protein LCGC14_0991190 [marine sediment metagenome]|uniref:Uncharacterized protein n=1 Tax=marine sediment metagenome TaxID=412755 RepID=A0A0F9NSC1_9ZZZZ